MKDLEWNLSHPAPIAVKLRASLSSSSQVALLQNFTVSKSSSAVGLWAVTVAVGAVASPVTVTSPSGFGLSTYAAAGLVESDAYSGLYPSSMATMQYMAAAGASGVGVYFGAHDGKAHSKTLSWAVTNASSDCNVAHPSSPGSA